MRVGQWVVLRTSTSGVERGRVDRVYADRSFRVTWADKGGRFTYPASVTFKSASA